MINIVTHIETLFAKWGTSKYDEQVSQLEHAVQCARFARAADADDGLVVGALLHDIGHLLELERNDGTVDLASNDSHESTGAAYLARFFPPAVTAPIALHVEAKRYLCAVESSYFATLSVGSVRSLMVQGGPMTTEEIVRFRKHPSAERAVALRRWDEQSKDLTPSGLSFADFGTEITRVLAST